MSGGEGVSAESDGTSLDRDYYLRATAEAFGLNPDAAVAHLDQTLARNADARRQAESGRKWCGHFSFDFNGDCMACARDEERRADMARAFNEGVIAQREATRAAGGNVGQIAAENPYLPPASEVRDV